MKLKRVLREQSGGRDVGFNVAYVNLKLLLVRD